MMKKIKFYSTLILLITILSACSSAGDKPYSFEEVKNDEFEHMHGLGYINGGPEIVISTHDGLYEYGEDGWKEATSEKHDYMGFQAVRDGFFTSGHPEPGSKLENPFGLIKSTDGGASFDKLGFYGEIDFHYLAAGYDSNVIYVLNEMATEKMSKGLYYTTDEGGSWNEVPMNGLDSEYISNLAAHPSSEAEIAIGSKDGLYLSDDYGESFSLFNETQMVTYVTLTEVGGLYADFESEEVKLKSFEFGSDEVVEISLLEISPIAFIAVNPEEPTEIVIATHNNDVYLTKDKGKSWDSLSENGVLVK